MQICNAANDCLRSALRGIACNEVLLRPSRFFVAPSRSEWLRPAPAVGARRAALLVIAASLVLVGTRTHAQAEPYRLALLELESDDVRDDFAQRLTARLRAALSEHREFELRYAPVSLAQLSLAHNCDTAQPQCLSAIARDLNLDGFVFGKATHEGGAPVVLLRRFDLASATVDRSALVAFSSLQLTRVELERGVDELLARLLAVKPTPASPRSAVPLAASGSSSQPMPTQEHAAPVLAPTAPAAAASGGTSTQAAFAYGLIAASVLSAGMAVASFVWVDQAENDPDFNSYRLAVGDQNPSARDVCDEAEAGHRYGLDAASFKDARDSCRTGATFEVLQYVFIATAVVAGGFGAYLLAADDSDTTTDSRARASVRLRPALARHALGITTLVQF